MRFQTTRWLGILCIGIVLIASCSEHPHDLVVAKIKDRTITLGEYESAINSVSPEYLPSSMEVSGLLEFLDTMIDRELLALKADELGYDKDPKVVDGMETFRAMGLQAGYLRVKIAHKMFLTDEDIEEAYKHYGLKYEVKQILTDTEAEGWEVHELLKSGHDFESVCKQYSRGPDAAQGGKLIGAVYGQFPPHFQDALFSTKVGDATIPIINRYGYFVIKVIEESQAPPPPLEQIRTQIERMATQQKQLRLSFDLSAKIRGNHNFQFHDDNLKIILEAMPPDQPITDPPPRSSEVYPLCDFDLEDLERPVVSYADEVLTIRDFSDLYDRAQFTMRPRREFRLGSLRKFMLDFAMNDLIELELEQSGIENEPEVTAMFQRKKEELMVNRLFFDLIDQQTTVPWSDVEDYYQDHQEQFYTDEQRKFNIILAGDRASADEARTLVLGGGHFQRIAARFAPQAEIEKTGIHEIWLTRDATPEIATYGFAMRDVGDISEPFEVSQGWVVAKLVDKRPAGYTPIDEASHNINHNLKQQANDVRLEKLLAKWREEVVIEINEGNLQKAIVTRRGDGAVPSGTR